MTGPGPGQWRRRRWAVDGALREYDLPLLAGLARGDGLPELARIHGLPKGTTDHRLVRLRGRIEARTSAHAVAIAYQRGWMAGLRPEPLPGELSARQLHVLAAIAEGHGTLSTAALLGLSRHTVTTHLRHIYTTLGVQTSGAPRCHAVALAHQHGLLPLPDPDPGRAG
ncbi:helix-turn-helix transcriptional regulator [Streptomyces sp. NPDC006798]|uniref:helix-turn-helix transcriptional regulator n=1 Tax=Streptomyces sp. NPDC006798 TaxID=3155462 RepID=UPI0033DAC777